MKRTIFSALLFSLLLVSCGGDEESKESEDTSGPTVCDCVKLDNEWKEAEDRDKFKEDHKSDWDACEKMMDEKKDEIEAIEDEDELKKAKDAFIELMKACKE